LQRTLHYLLCRYRPQKEPKIKTQKNAQQVQIDDRAREGRLGIESGQQSRSQSSQVFSAAAHELVHRRIEQGALIHQAHALGRGGADSFQGLHHL